MRNAFPAGGTQSAGRSTRRGASAGFLRSFVGLVLVAQLLGGALAVAILVRDTPARAASLGQAVPTSFGVVSVDQVESIPASNPDRDTLLPGLQEVQVAVTMTNLLALPVPYARDAVDLRVVGSSTSIPVSSASVRKGRLRPGSAFRMVFRFDVPTAATHFWLQLRDPGAQVPVRVDLGDGPFPVGVSSAYNPRLHVFTPHENGGGP